nr:MAG TPA: hypothetical protein [Caudoviricetes sp.]
MSSSARFSHVEAWFRSSRAICIRCRAASLCSLILVMACSISSRSAISGPFIESLLSVRTARIDSRLQHTSVESYDPDELRTVQITLFDVEDEIYTAILGIANADVWCVFNGCTHLRTLFGMLYSSIRASRKSHRSSFILSMISRFRTLGMVISRVYPLVDPPRGRTRDLTLRILPREFLIQRRAKVSASGCASSSSPISARISSADFISFTADASPARRSR